MESNAATRHRRDIHRILTAALHAADAGRAVERVFRREGDALFVDGERLPLEPGSRLLVAGAGKVAAVMARAVAAVAGPLLTEGVVVSGAIGAMEEIHGVRVMVASHPYPDQGSLAAAAAILELVRDAGSDDVVLFLLAGGASAMLEQPVAGISLADLQAVTRLLLNAGASIVELNEVRKALSVVKAGGIVRAAAPAFTQTLAVSDVVGNSSAVIGSAPTVPGVSDAARAVNVLERYGLPPRLDGVVEVLRRAGAYAADVNETSTGYHVIASVDDALAGAARGARAAGYDPEIVCSSVVGEAREVGKAWGRMARQAASGRSPRCLLAGGETTVRVVGDGCGGRNQEVALAAGMELAGQAGVTVAAIGTDGHDGPTDAAGAVADGTTVERGRRLGNEAAGFLADNDSYTFFAELDDLVTTGPTRTNVMDLHIALVGLPDGR